MTAVYQLGGCLPCPKALGIPQGLQKCPCHRSLRLKAAHPRGSAQGSAPRVKSAGVETVQTSWSSLGKPPAFLFAFPANLLTLKRGKLMLFLMKRVKFSASRRRAGLEETTLIHCPLPRRTLCAHQSLALYVGWENLWGQWRGGYAVMVTLRPLDQGPGASLATQMGSRWGWKKGQLILSRACIQMPLCLGWGPSSQLSGRTECYRGILSSTSTGHQPKISHVCTVLLKATHLPVRMPGAREESMSVHPKWVCRGGPPVPPLGSPSDRTPKSRGLRTEMWLGLGRGRPRSGWQEGREQEGLPGRRSLGLTAAVEGVNRRPTLPWAFLSAFPGLQPLSSMHVPPSGCWGRGDLLAPGPSGGVLKRVPPIPKTPGRAGGRVPDCFGVTLAHSLLPTGPSQGALGLMPSCPTVAVSRQWVGGWDLGLGGP